MFTEPEMEKYPPAIYAIVISEFCARFAFCGIRTLLSLYLRNALYLPENESTVVYHIFIMLCFTVPVLGAITADGCLGRFRTILLFSVVCTLGHVFTFLGATPLPSTITWTMVGLTLMAVGAGGVKPCVAPFGGDQFHLPLQQKLLQQFFSLFYFTANLGGLAGMLVTPLLRQAVSCFGNEFCYSLAFGLPAVLAVFSVVVFLGGKPCYRIKAPKENVIATFICCAFYAIVMKIRKRKEESLPHWLDYAARKYDSLFIRDMKAVLAIFVLFIPLPVFWSLLVQQGSRWTFQATRMNGQLLGIELLPDQVQAISPAVVLFLIPLFNKFIYPRFARYNVLVSPLQRMAVGGVIAGLAFVCAGILEYGLQQSYPPLPPNHEGQIILINTLPCDLRIEAEEKSISLPNSQTLTLTNIPVDHETVQNFEIISPNSCGSALAGRNHAKAAVTLHEKDTKTVLVAVDSEKLKTYTLASEDLSKALNGRPKIRIALIREGNVDPSSVTIYDQRGFSRFYYVGDKFLGLTNYTEMRPGRYSYFVTYANDVDEEFQGFLVVKPGGVYSLVLREHDSKIVFAQNFALTPPNHIHILWLVPQFVLISVAEVLIAISGLEFCFTQAPKSMKTVTMAAWYFTVACGNLLIIAVTQMLRFNSQVVEFLFFAVLLLFDLVLFMWISMRYHFRVSEYEESRLSVLDVDDTYPLLEMPSH